jgi:hypothetical protein
MPALRIASLCAGALLWAALSAGYAAPLAPAAVSGRVSLNFIPPFPVDVDGFGHFAVHDPGGSAQFDVEGLPRSSLYGEVSVNPGFTGRAVGRLTFEVQILGPGGQVPVLVAATGRAIGASNTVDPFAGFNVTAQWALEDVTLGLQPVFSESIESGPMRGSFNESFGHSVPLTLTANHIYRVTMGADAFAAAVSGPTAFASAFIDPVFSFGPDVDRAYSFAFSEGIGNAPVPEPGAWLLLIAGLLALRTFGTVSIGRSDQGATAVDVTPLR